MEFAGVNYIAVIVAAIASMAVGALWYTMLGKVWMAAAGLKPDDLERKPSLHLISLICALIMAWMLAGIIGHIGMASIKGGVITAAFCWFGFIATAMTVNHRFRGANWNLTFIDGGHWLAALVVQGAILGAFGV
jgi:hypothetical protein